MATPQFGDGFAGLVSFPVAEGWVQVLCSHLLRDPPRGFAKISLQQILDCDKQLFTVASHRTMGNLQVGPNNVKPLDAIFNELRSSGEVLQFLTPLPATRSHEPPQASGSRPEKQSKTDRPSNKGDRKVLARMPAIQKCSSQRVAPHTMMKTGLFVLHFRTTSASSRGRQERDVPEDIISATRRVLSQQTLLLVHPYRLTFVGCRR